VRLLSIDIIVCAFQTPKEKAKIFVNMTQNIFTACPRPYTLWKKKSVKHEGRIMHSASDNV